MNESAGSEVSEVELGQRRTRRVSQHSDKQSRDKADKGKGQNACGNRDKNEQMRRYRVLGRQRYEFYPSIFLALSLLQPASRV